MMIEYTVTRTINNICVTESVKITPCENEQLDISMAIKEISNAIRKSRVDDGQLAE